MSCLLAGLLGVWGRGGTPTPARRQVSTFGVLGVKLGDVSLSLSISLSLSLSPGLWYRGFTPYSLSLSLFLFLLHREGVRACPPPPVAGSGEWICTVETTSLKLGLESERSGERGAEPC